MINLDHIDEWNPNMIFDLNFLCYMYDVPIFISTSICKFHIFIISSFEMIQQCV